MDAMSMNSDQAKRAAKKRWNKRPVKTCTVCGDEHRCYAEVGEVPREERRKAVRAARVEAS